MAIIRVYLLMDRPVQGKNYSILFHGSVSKSFTMMGTDNPAEFGLIPRICFGLFECNVTNHKL